MGLDIYAGTLTRYYSHNWKTVVQQWAEENGYAFNRITPDGETADNEEEMSPAEIQAAVENWRDQILSAISQPGQPPYTPWPEDNEKPYYTDKPDWDAFGAMLLVAACHTYDEPVPPTVEKDWNFGEHPLVARLGSDEERVWSLLRGATWWLPLPDSFLFQAPLPTDDQAMIATLGGLRKELEKLNQLAWQADEDTSTLSTALRWTQQRRSSRSAPPLSSRGITAGASMCGSRWWNGTERRSRWRSTAVRQNCAEHLNTRQKTGWVRCCSTSPTPMMWIMPGPQAAPKRNWTRWWNPLCRPSGRQDSGHRRMRRAISSTGRKQTRRSAPFGYGISSPTPAACRKSLSRKSWSFGGNCSQKRRRKPNEQ